MKPNGSDQNASYLLDGQRFKKNKFLRFWDTFLICQTWFKQVNPIPGCIFNEFIGSENHSNTVDTCACKMIDGVSYLRSLFARHFFRDSCVLSRYRRISGWLPLFLFLFFYFFHKERERERDSGSIPENRQSETRRHTTRVGFHSDRWDWGGGVGWEGGGGHRRPTGKTELSTDSGGHGRCELGTAAAMALVFVRDSYRFADVVGGRRGPGQISLHLKHGRPRQKDQLVIDIMTTK